jgi:hypothetical protein
MSVRAAISAFAHRGARRGTASSFVLYSALLAVALLALAAWIAPEARLGDLEWVSRFQVPLPEQLDPSLWTTLALADIFACWVLALACFVIAPAMVAATVAHERRAGTLDQLRTTPLSPLGLACGMIVGIPARLYLLCLGPLALHVVAALAGPLPLAVCVQSLAVLAAGTAASCALGLCVALAPRQESGGTFAALGVAALLATFGLVTCGFAAKTVPWAFLHPAGAFSAAMLQPHSLWLRIVFGPYYGPYYGHRYVHLMPLVPLASVAASLTVATMLTVSACRKLGAPARPLFGKRQAVVLFAMTATALLLPTAALHDPWVSVHSIDSDVAWGFSLLLLPPVRPVLDADVRSVGVAPPSRRAAVVARRRRRSAWRRLADGGVVGRDPVGAARAQ